MGYLCDLVCKIMDRKGANEMKKLAILALALSSFIFSASAFAATSDGALTGDNKSRNDKTVFTTANTADAKSNMPCFRAGDKIQFNVTGLTENKQLTLISYKVKDENNLDDTSIQYINQYTVGSNETEKAISYAVRDIDDGIYKIAVNGNDGTSLIEMYYKVGTPKFEMVKGKTEGVETAYIQSEQGTDDSYALGYVGKATLTDSDVSLSDTGVKSVGFEFSKQDGEKTLKGSKYENLSGIDSEKDLESNGSITFVYGVTLYNVPAADKDAITVTAGEGTVAAEEVTQ